MTVYNIDFCKGGILVPVQSKWKGEITRMTPNQQLQPLTSKELDYIADCISNETMLAKHCAATAAASQNSAIQQALLGFVSRHEQHLDTLVNSLQSHIQVAPTQPQ